MDFEAEGRAWEGMKGQLLQSHPGQFAVFDGRQLVAVETTHRAAVTEGIRQTRKLRFLVQRVVEQDDPVVVPAYVHFG